MARQWRNGCIAMIAALFMAVFWAKIIFAAEEGTCKQQQAGTESIGTAAGWDEEYTDTDTRKGTLLIRCQTFQGFHGTVEIIIRNIAGGWEHCITLTGEGDYALSLPLPAETYQLVGAEAWTGRRSYDCRSHQAEFIISAEQSTLLQVSVSPDSIYRLQEEEEMTAERIRLEQAETTGEALHKMDEPNSGESRHIQQDAGAGNQRKAQSTRRRSGFFAGGALGLAVCLGSIFYMARKNNE